MTIEQKEQRGLTILDILQACNKINFLKEKKINPDSIEPLKAWAGDSFPIKLEADGKIYKVNVSPDFVAGNVFTQENIDVLNGCKNLPHIYAVQAIGEEEGRDTAFVTEFIPGEHPTYDDLVKEEIRTQLLDLFSYLNQNGFMIHFPGSYWNILIGNNNVVYYIDLEDIGKFGLTKYKIQPPILELYELQDDGRMDNIYFNLETGKPEWSDLIE
jgi:hypothetical protein